MRIISGIYGSRRINLKLPPGIRPTTDSNKETIFNILSNHLNFEDTLVLDLFAGSGGLGFETISRGAKHCTFVDSSFKSIQHIKQIADLLQIKSDKFSAIKTDAIKFLKKVETDGQKYDIIFLDPPYHLKIADIVVESICKYNLTAINGFIIAESSFDEHISPLDGYTTINHKASGETQLHIIQRTTN